MKTVLYVNYYASPVSTRMLDGVFRYAHTAKWNVQVIDKVSEKALSKLMEFWNPVGCIYGANDGIKPNLIKIISKRPLVLLDGDPDYECPFAGKICSDSESVAGMVAREFLSMGLEDFAFCGYKNFYSWTERRERSFRKLLKLNGKTCKTIWIDPSDAEDDRLKAALRKLPRPCGLFVVNDDIGRRVLGACRMARIPVPEGVSVISVDDDAHICENTKPPLSSVLPENEQAGFLAGKLLDEIVGGGPPRTIFFGAKAFIRRGSSHAVRVSDKRVKDAVDFIRGSRNAALSAEEVARRMGCTLRMAEILFKRSVGHSVKAEILDAKIDRVKHLLEDRCVGISAIADMCGYADSSSLRRAFLARVGCSMSEWRRGFSR